MCNEQHTLSSMLNRWSWNQGPPSLRDASLCWCLSGHCRNTTEVYRDLGGERNVINLEEDAVAFEEENISRPSRRIVIDGH